jgi:hypothetical protein
MIHVMDEPRAPLRSNADPRRIRHDLDLAVVTEGPAGAGARVTAGRLVAWMDGRWSLTLPVGGVPVEARGDRDAGGRAAALLILRSGAGPDEGREGPT